jgi:small-conductance mechanosensitive channel
MGRLALALTLVLAAALGCRKQQRSNETGGMSDTSLTTTAAPAPQLEDTAPAATNFGFDQRQEFAQSVRQQLVSLDQQISDLASQAKSLGGAVSDRALANVRASRRAVDRSLRQVDAATAANWDRVKQGARSTVDNLSEAIEAAQPK